MDYLTYGWKTRYNYFISPTSVYTLHITRYFVLKLEIFRTKVGKGGLNWSNVSFHDEQLH